MGPSGLYRKVIVFFKNVSVAREALSTDIGLKDISESPKKDILLHSMGLFHRGGMTVKSGHPVLSQL